MAKTIIAACGAGGEGLERGEVRGGRGGIVGAGEGVPDAGGGGGRLRAGGGNDGGGKSGDEASVAGIGRGGEVDREADGDGARSGALRIGEMGIVERGFELLPLVDADTDAGGAPVDEFGEGGGGGDVGLGGGIKNTG